MAKFCSFGSFREIIFLNQQYMQKTIGEINFVKTNNQIPLRIVAQLALEYLDQVLMTVLGLLLFPFSRTDWSLRYNAEEPVQPKFDLNAPDLYIPTMAYVTYVLLVGYILGLKNAFR